MPRPLRVLLRSLLALTVLFAMGLGAAALRIDDVRASASQARTAAGRAAKELRRGDFAAATVSLEIAIESLAGLRAQLSHPQFAVARITPWLGDEIAATGSLIDAAGVAADTLRGLAQRLEPILGSDEVNLFRGNGNLDLSQLDELRALLAQRVPAIQEAAANATRSFGKLRSGTARTAAEPLVADLIRVRDTLVDGVGILELLPGLVGHERPRTLLIVLQNLAESRGTGGLIGGYAILRADAGQLTMQQIASNQDLKAPFDAANVPMPAWFSSRYDRYSARNHWSNVNMHPDLPITAPLIAQLFEDTTGVAVDGVMMMDPVTLEYLVNATGTVTIPSLTFEPSTTAETIMIDSYARFEVGNDELGGSVRKAAMVELAAKLLPRILDPRYIVGIATALGGAASTRHLALWSDDADEQARIAALGLDGSVLGGDGAWIGVGFNNGAANKMDAYLQRSMTVSTVADGEGIRVTARAGFSLDVSDLFELPSIVTGPVPDTEDLVAGQSRLLVALYLPPEATVTDRSDGSVISRVPGALVVDAVVDVFPMQPADLQVTFTLPIGSEGPVAILSAPGARPLVVSGAATLP